MPSGSMHACLLKLRMWAYSGSVIPAFRVVILEHSLTLFLLKFFSTSEVGMTGATFDRITLPARVNIGLMFSILLLIVIVLCRFVRCSTVSFLSRYAQIRLLMRFWRCTLLFWDQLVSLLRRHSLECCIVYCVENDSLIFCR